MGKVCPWDEILALIGSQHPKPVNGRRPASGFISCGAGGVHPVSQQSGNKAMRRIVGITIVPVLRKLRCFCESTVSRRSCSGQASVILCYSGVIMEVTFIPASFLVKNWGKEKGQSRRAATVLGRKAGANGLAHSVQATVANVRNVVDECLHVEGQVIYVVQWRVSRCMDSRWARRTRRTAECGDARVRKVHYGGGAQHGARLWTVRACEILYGWTQLNRK